MTSHHSPRELLIEARGLTKRYGATVAVDDLSFDVLPGQVTGFLGPNGAGKSTTLRMILGLDTPTAGTVTIGGKRYNQHRRPLYEVGALLDAKAIHGGRSAFNHLLSLAQSNGIPRSRVGEVLETVGLTSVAKKRAGGFSLGMGQRLGIAAALLGQPDVLLFDEPVNGLDPEGIVWIRNFMRSLAADGHTVFVSSHLMSEMALTADHLVVIGRGKLIAATSVAEFIARSSDNYVLVRTDQADRLLPLLDAATSVDLVDGALHVSGLDCRTIGDIAATHFIALHELSPQMASLEDAFMELTHDSVDYTADVPVAHLDARKVA
ncbi:MAG: type transport system ATP-binding protein [Actinomycetota bacterium]|jgi:ABC-2 type transport system ATP-binding protein|nr:type transport system ATP-binding protein [Actinomycetota bacterium]